VSRDVLESFLGRKLVEAIESDLKSRGIDVELFYAAVNKAVELAGSAAVSVVPLFVPDPWGGSYHFFSLLVLVDCRKVNAAVLNRKHLEFIRKLEESNGDKRSVAIIGGMVVFGCAEEISDKA